MWFVVHVLLSAVDKVQVSVLVLSLSPDFSDRKVIGLLDPGTDR